MSHKVTLRGVKRHLNLGKMVISMENDLLLETVKNPLYDDKTNLKQILSLNLYKILEEMEKKILNGRIKNPDAEKIRLEYIKAYINGCNCFKSITDNANASTMYNSDVIKKYLDTSVEMQDIEPEETDELIAGQIIITD